MVPGNVFFHEEQRVAPNVVPAGEGEESARASANGISSLLEMFYVPWKNSCCCGEKSHKSDRRKESSLFRGIIFRWIRVKGTINPMFE